MKFFCEENFDLFSQILAVNPTVIMGEICNLPLAENIFGVDSFINTLKGLSPPAGELLEIDEGLRRQSLAAQMALHHYFRFPPIEDLSPSLPRAVVALRKSAANEDLLIQSPKYFLSQIAFLLQRILGVPSVETGKTEISGFISPPQRHTQEAAWQAATLIGSAYSYGVNFARTLSKDIQMTENLIRGATEIFTTALSIAGRPTGPAGGAVDTTSVIFGKLSDVVAQWVARPDQSLDLKQLAQDLAYLSDSVRTRAERGLVVVGAPELSEEEIRNLSENKQEVRQRVEVGRIFSRNYGKYLANFKEHYLQRSLKESAQ